MLLSFIALFRFLSPLIFAFFDGSLVDPLESIWTVLFRFDRFDGLRLVRRRFFFGIRRLLPDLLR